MKTELRGRILVLTNKAESLANFKSFVDISVLPNQVIWQDKIHHNKYDKRSLLHRVRFLFARHSMIADFYELLKF